jgi:hypothetical protein
MVEVTVSKKRSSLLRYGFRDKEFYNTGFRSLHFEYIRAKQAIQDMLPKQASLTPISKIPSSFFMLDVLSSSLCL